ncbi:hypothetical protein GCM10011514_06240 [Emticicia aquatilis]|uniref:Uncharacterized protein n=1 Tax=Emticicia aquatilis TaxID=1537369 RepID=A0A916YHK0_9BACT|nr:hypothetical protein [Emticicia aquatilis]GGD44982.1 hypothetical protein GCM10011514_06240 [Emticicia aquatilis]
MLDDLFNSGGIYRLVVVSDDGFETEPFLGVWADASIKDGAVMCEFLFAHGTCSLSIKDRLNENGILCVSQIILDLAKITVELQRWLYLHAERRWVCFAEDFNGYTHIIGEPHTGCRLSTNQVTGERSSSKNLTTITLEVSSIYRPIITTMNFVDLTSNRLKIDLRRYAERDFYAYEGDTINEVLTFRDANSNIENLTGNSFKMQVRDFTGAVITSFVMGNGFVLQNNNTELLMFKSDIIASGEYDYDLQRTYPDGTIETQLKGRFIIEKQITI